jgi:hypothetical protein
MDFAFRALSEKRNNESFLGALSELCGEIIIQDFDPARVTIQSHPFLG